MNDVFYKDGSNASFFLSDGAPNYSVYNKENDWENFLITNKIKSSALGFGGLNNTYELEPLAFDGTKVTKITDDHTPGEIPAEVTLDTGKIGSSLISQAKLDFIENLVGTNYDDTLAGNSLDNQIFGNDGADTIGGGTGNDTLDGGFGYDTALFGGKKDGYLITETIDDITIKDIDLADGDDGTDILYSIENLKFSDVEYKAYDTQDVNSSYFSMKFTQYSGVPLTQVAASDPYTLRDFLYPILTHPEENGTSNSTSEILDLSKISVIKYKFDKDGNTWPTPNSEDALDSPIINDNTLPWVDNKTIRNIDASTTYKDSDKKEHTEQVEFKTDLFEVQKTVKKAVLDAFHEYESILPIKFEEVKKSEVANLDFHIWDYFEDPSFYAVSPPMKENKTDKDGYMAFGLNNIYKLTQTQITDLIIHELGHSFGLWHPHPDYKGNDSLPGVDDNNDIGTFGANYGLTTTMSYNKTWLHPEVKNATAPDLMNLDIIALQALYDNHRIDFATGPTSYSLDDVKQNTWKTIWDQGDTDLLKYTGSKDVVLDLRAPSGKLESIVDSIEDVRGYQSYIKGQEGGLIIAHDVVIENASGGSGNDTIYGNKSNNTLSGGKGNDTIEGRDGNDTIIGGEGKDIMTGGSGNDTFKFESLKDISGDIIKDFERGVDKIDLSFLKNATVLFVNSTALNIDTNNDGKTDHAIVVSLFKPDGNFTFGDIIVGVGTTITETPQF